MSLYRTVLATLAAVAIASPVFADDSATSTDSSSTGTNQATMQTSDNSSASTEATTTEQVKVNLNTASAKELMKVKGLNASKARAIVAFRKKHGNFKSTDDLANVKGFKKMNADALKSIEDQLTVE